MQFVFFLTWKLFLKVWIEAALIHFHKTSFHFLESETEVFWDTERPDRDHWGTSSYPVLEAGTATPKSCAEGNGWNICPAAPPVSCATWTGSYDRGGPLGQSGFRVLPPPSSPAGVLTLRWSTASMRGSPSHRLGFSCFSVLFCWFVFDFCLESWNVLGKLFLRKFISNPSTLFRAPAYLTPPASPCSSTVTTFFPSFQCPGEAGASRPRSVKSKSNGPPVKMASQAANPATLGKKQKESIFLCNGHPRRSLPVRGAFVSHQRGTKGNISFFF